MANEGKIIRAGVTSNGFMAGTLVFNFCGTFSAEDVEDAVAMIDIAVRSIKRQAAQVLPSPPESEHTDAE